MKRCEINWGFCLIKNSPFFASHKFTFCRYFWHILTCFDTFWFILKMCEINESCCIIVNLTYMLVLTHFDMFRCIPMHYDSFWHKLILVSNSNSIEICCTLTPFLVSRRDRHIMMHFDAFWHNLPNWNHRFWSKCFEFKQLFFGCDKK